MKRVLFTLPFTFSPAFAVGFWVNIGGGLNFGGFTDICDNSVCLSEFLSILPAGFIPGMNISAGLSLAPITPIFVGAGFDFYTGKQRYLLSGYYEYLDAKRFYVKLPIGYRISLPIIIFDFGIYPAYAMYSVKPDGYGNFQGFAFGSFANAYYFIGPIGFGGGVFIDYAPKLPGEYIEGEEYYTLYLKNVLHAGINLGIALSLGVLE